MSNLLNRLAGRALEVIPVVEPIVPARFSPALRQHEALDPPHSGLYQEYVAAARNTAAASPPISGASQKLMQYRPATHSPMLEDRAQQSERASIRPKFTEPANGSSAESSEAVARRTDNRTLPVQRGRTQRLVRNEKNDPVAVDQLGIHEGISRSAHAGTMNTMLPASLDRQRRSEGYPINSSATPAPSIKVTIGRIEVRAMNAPIAQAAPRNNASTVSLNQFLKQRSAGGR